MGCGNATGVVRLFVVPFGSCALCHEKIPYDGYSVGGEGALSSLVLPVSGFGRGCAVVPARVPCYLLLYAPSICTPTFIPRPLVFVVM